MKRDRLKNGTVIFSKSPHLTDSDGPLLASFVALKKSDRLLDLCSGNGIVPLWLIDNGFKGEIFALDIQHEAVRLIRQAVTENNLDNFEAGHMDLNAFQTGKKFDVVSCNPPYYPSGSGKKSPDIARATARTETSADIYDVLNTAAGNLKEGGRFYCCWPPNRMESLFSALRQSGFSPKKLRFCRHSPEKSPWLLLLEARFHSGEGLTVMNDFIRESDGIVTEEYLGIIG